MLQIFANILGRQLKSSSLCTQIMSEVKLKKPKYNGGIKKRKWEERRSDYQQEDSCEPKVPKVEAITAPVDKVRKRKYAMMLGYSGVDYFGMQRNPDSKTIEEDLIKALFKGEFINDEAFNNIQTIQFQRAARTDKGVSAVRQVVSVKLPENISVQAVNAHLPEQIRVFAVKRVTKGFNSKSTCNARTYSYILPTVAFANFEQDVDQNEFRIPSETIEKVNELLKIYIGTKNFHNFTSKRKPTDPSAKRYIMSFVCDPPFVRKGVEFTVMKVKGQSFMLHQIRKMIGLVLMIIRGHTTEDVVKQVFTTERVNVPKAPGLGLLLEYVHYDSYNYRYGEDGIHEKLTWEEVEDDVSEFKEKFIYPTIVDAEVEEMAMSTWLQKLVRHRYDVFDEKADGEESDGEKCRDEDSKDSDGEEEKVQERKDVQVQQTS